MANTVKELIQYLQSLPEEAQDSAVYFSVDPEGNGYWPWSGEHSYALARDEYSTWDEDHLLTEDYSDEDEDAEDYVPFTAETGNAVILWP